MFAGRDEEAAVEAETGGYAEVVVLEYCSLCTEGRVQCGIIKDYTNRPITQTLIGFW